MLWIFMCWMFIQKQTSEGVSYSEVQKFMLWFALKQVYYVANFSI